MTAPVLIRLACYALIVLLFGGCTIQTEPSADHEPDSHVAAQSTLADAIARAQALTPQSPFIAHTNPTPFGRYVAMNVPFEPIYALNRQLSTGYGQELSDRGEAHITVITPPEYQRLAPYIDIGELNEFFAPVLQSVDFQAVCIGRGQKELDGTVESTYFVVIKSKQLLRLRQRVAQRYLERGGPQPAFEQQYYPHITIGFTRRDLHASDGIIKSPATCLTETF